MPAPQKDLPASAAPAPGSAALLDPRLPRVWQVRRPHARLLAEARVHNAGGKGTEAAGASGAGGGGRGEAAGQVRECREERADGNTAGKQADDSE